MIKADGSRKVKGRLALRPPLAGLRTTVLLCLALSSSLYVVPAKAQGQPPVSEAAAIKPIEAEEFRVRLIKSSTSGRVLLFQDLETNKPRPGKILLIKDGANEIVAVRVLKTYPPKNQFAAKIVLPFGITPELSREYRSLKKIGDKLIELIRARENSEKNLEATKTDEELASEVPPDDHELDRGIPTEPLEMKPEPAPELKAEPAQAKPAGPQMPEPLWDKDGNELTPESLEVIEEEEPFDELSVREETTPLLVRHAVTAQYASINSVEVSGAARARHSGGIRYGFNVAQKLLLKRPGVLDVLTIEGGLFSYRITGFLQPGDSVSVYPVVGALRYNVILGQSLSVFAYMGAMQNLVQAALVESTTPPQTAPLDPADPTSPLRKTRLSAGVGGFLSIGPSWALRVDAGTDLFAVGATLKF